MQNNINSYKGSKIFLKIIVSSIFASVKSVCFLIKFMNLLIILIFFSIQNLNHSIYHRILLKIIIISIVKMSYYDYNDSAKKSYNRDPFGDITQHNSASKGMYEDSYRSPVKERLYQAKDSITGTLNNLSANKYAYNECASEVMMVNQQLLNSLKYSSPVMEFPNYENIEEKNLQLRRQLNQQMRKSNALLRQYSQLQSQNKGLKRQQSYYNSTAADTNNLRYQNDRLREQIQRKRQQMSVPQHLVDQLKQLRRENERLRQNAANLLYKKKSNY